MADNKQYDNTNRFSLWARDKGPVTFSGFINVNGSDYNIKLLRLAKEPARAFVLIEDKESYAPVGGGYLYDSKFDDVFLSGKITVGLSDFYLNMYKNDKGGEKSPTFSGKLKAADGSTSKKSAPAQEEDDEW
jgi:hypothetical protein